MSVVGSRMGPVLLSRTGPGEGRGRGWAELVVLLRRSRGRGAWGGEGAAATGMSEGVGWMGDRIGSGGGIDELRMPAGEAMSLVEKVRVPSDGDKAVGEAETLTNGGESSGEAKTPPAIGLAGDVAALDGKVKGREGEGSGCVRESSA